MQINSAFHPPSSIIRELGEATKKNVPASQNDASLITPEQINERVDQLQQQVLSEQQAQQQQQENTRTFALNIYDTNNKQELIDIYLQVATGESSDSDSDVRYQALADIYQSEDFSQTEQLLDKLPEQSLPERNLQERIDNRPSIPEQGAYNLVAADSRPGQLLDLVV
ncbi:hypothetical protein [Agaribacterium haliotis]|uniref:hypothetical protein n=1 Tax=Agaribacterium haliotis TaxID=2013869 RepID=UPI000BB584A9|nr:hypothetical protein [Agaribacterium haliotis]